MRKLKAIVIKGLSWFEMLIILWVIIWCIFMTGVQIGILHGRKMERNCWEIALNEVNQEYEQLLILERIIRLESGGRHEGIWGADGERGVLQFKRATFEFLKDKAGMPDLKWERQIDQIILCNYAIRNGYAEKHWTTYSKAKEGN